MDLGIAGKVAVITGASSGLGKAVAYALAAEGVGLALFARSGDALRTIAADIEKQHGVPAMAVAGDMRIEADVERLVRELQHKFGAPDILVLNTGRPPKPMHEVLDEKDDAKWEEAYRVQLWGAILVARRIVPLIVERGWGRVIAIATASVKHPMPKHGLSTIFKAGLMAYTKHLANEIAAKGVTVNTISPGSIDSNVRPAEVIAARLKTVPLGRFGRPEEFAATVAFLASQQAGFITGANVQIDGGMAAALY